MSAVARVSFDMRRGETVALVGETGCGKSTLALALLGLLGSRGRIESGTIEFEGRPLAGLKEGEWRGIRGAAISLIFQDARGALNPVLTVGRHIVETLRAHRRISIREAGRAAREILAEVGLPDPSNCSRRYPSELSGGMCQRVGIALAICGRPRLLIADEPTSALDPGIQAQILDLLDDLKRRQKLAVLLVSHDLAMVSGFADRVLVMYGGSLVESGRSEDVFGSPAHPYTRALLRCLPGDGSGPLAVIPGTPPVPGSRHPGCPFAPRCDSAVEACGGSFPAWRMLSDTHGAACSLAVQTPTDGSISN